MPKRECLRDVRDDERLPGAAHLLKDRPEIRRASLLFEPEVADDFASIPQFDGKDDHRAAKRLGRPEHDFMEQVLFARTGARVRGGLE